MGLTDVQMFDVCLIDAVRETTESKKPCPLDSYCMCQVFMGIRTFVLTCECVHANYFGLTFSELFFLCPLMFY